MNRKRKPATVDRTPPVKYEPSKYCRSWKELATMKCDDSPMLWDGLLPDREIAMLAGIGGYGKSSLARQLAIAIASGDSEFLSRRLHAPNRRVLYVSCEDGEKRVGRIVQSIGRPSTEGLHFIFASELTLTSVLVELSDQILQAPVDLIVIDSLGNLFEGDQNSNADAQAFYAQFGWFAQQAVVLFLHHVRKSDHRSTPDQVSIQGAGAFVQRARAVLMLTGDKYETERYLHMEKENDVSGEFKYDALILDFDMHRKLYSSDGETKAISEINRPAQPLTDTGSLFNDGETELPASDLIPRIMSKYGIRKRAAKERLKASGLTRIRHGWYARPANDALKVQKVQRA